MLGEDLDGISAFFNLHMDTFGIEPGGEPVRGFAAALVGPGLGALERIAAHTAAHSPARTVGRKDFFASARRILPYRLLSTRTLPGGCRVGVSASSGVLQLHALCWIQRYYA